MALRYGAIDEVTIMCATYYARASDHGYETCAEHLAMAGCLAGGFAKGFGYLDDGLLAGLVHDLGNIRMLSSGESAIPIIADPSIIRRPVRCC